MDGVIFGTDKAEQTIFVFTIVLLSLIFIPTFYLALRQTNLGRLQNKSLFRDWRFLIPMIVYALLLGFRYDYYYDWEQYKNIFLYLQKGLLYRENAEVGYLFINKLLIQCGFNYYSIFILEGVVYVYSYYFLFKDSRRYLPFVLPLVFMAQFNNCLNISRQFFATSILFVAYRFLLEGNKKVYIGASILAGLIHNSAFLWMPFFYLFSKMNRIQLNLKLVAVISTILGLGIFLFKNSLYQVLDNIFMTLFTGSFYAGNVLSDKYTGDGLSFSMILVRLLKMLTFIYIFSKQDKANLFKCSILRNYIIIGILGMPMILLFSANELFLRLFFYISIFTDIGWGILLYNMIFEKKSVRYNIIDYVLVAICIFHYFWQFYSYMIYTFGNSLTNPYIIYK